MVNTFDFAMGGTTFQISDLGNSMNARECDSAISYGFRNMGAHKIELSNYRHRIRRNTSTSL
jgi:hypothetical protein